MKNILHYIQMKNRQQLPFREYDYGASKNMEVYGSAEPPVIDFNNINKFKVAMFAARWDQFTTLTDNKVIRTMIQRAQSESIYWTEFDGGVLSFYTTSNATHLTILPEIWEDIMVFDPRPKRLHYMK